LPCKTSARVADVALKSLTILADDGPVRRRIVVCMECQPREVSDRHGRITILPVNRFLEELWAGKVVLRR
jgi:hypothetical protein